MVPSQSKLAEALNALVNRGRVVVSETSLGIAVNQLNGTEADQVIGLLESAGWTSLGVEDQGGEIPRNHVASSGDGVRVTATRPPTPAGIDAVVTSSGFSALLERDPTASVVWIEGLTSKIDTRTVRYAPWGDIDDFKPIDEPSNPAKVVRVLGNNGPGGHIGRWLLRIPQTQIKDAAATPWRVRAASRLLRAMAQEIEPDDKLLFKGPPAARFTVSGSEELIARDFAVTQSVAAWVYENDRELENRHGLLAAEVARTSLRDGDAQALAGVLGPALEGARIAYNFGVTQQSKDTLKALGDLRKTVSDDATKLSETTRTLAGAVVGAVFGNIGLIVARLTLPANGIFVGPAAVLLGVVLGLYVLATIASGWHYILVQQELRREWKDRLYRFLPDDDYKRLVTNPAKRAETAFWCTAAVGAFMTGLLLTSVYYVAITPVP